VDGSDERRTAELVAAAATGDQSAWDSLVGRYSGLVWSVTRSHRLGTADAADVFQTVWLRLVEHLDRLREPDHVGGWLAATARHECLRVLRSASRELPDEDVALARDAGTGRGDRSQADRLGLAPAPNPEAAVLASEERAALLAAYGRLSDRCRELLGLLVCDPPQSYAEISASLDMPIGSIGPTRGRCLTALRGLLESTDSASPPGPSGPPAGRSAGPGGRTP
jgi:RNA polymerase sigma factor (sigma-70 family)